MADHSKRIFDNKRFFYIALAVCMLALGSASASALKSYRDVQKEETSLAASVPDSAPDAKKANEPLTDVPYSETESAVSEAENTSEPTSQVQSEQCFILPVGGKILKDFDDRNLQYSETYKDWRLHLALDIAADKGTAVFSASRGTVEEIYEDSLLGTVVKIDHQNGLVAYYCGLNSSPSVKKGQEVEPGYQLGAIAEIPCESVEQTHLHFVMEQDGTPVSPLKVMQMKE